MNCKSLSFVFFFLVFLLALAPASAQDTADCAVQVTEPRPEQMAPGRIAVEGTATVPPGHHVWVFARRFDFEPRWWPQGEASVDPTTGKWRRFATLGGDQDAGWQFDVTAAVFAAQQHHHLWNHFSRDMDTGDFRSLDMPTAACAAAPLRVTRRKD